MMSQPYVLGYGIPGGRQQDVAGLTGPQRRMLASASAAWSPIPAEIAITNRTLRALDDRGLVFLRRVAHVQRGRCWQWRRT